MWNDSSVIIDCLYGMEYKPTTKQVKDREAKVKAAIAVLGEKYLLAHHVEKKNGQRRH